MYVECYVGLAAGLKDTARPTRGGTARAESGGVEV
jgi:hypothetical protein